MASIAGMLLGIAGTVAPQGTVLQRTLFLLSASILAVTAYRSDQTMLTVLQTVVTISAILAFIPGLGLQTRLLLVLGPAIIATGYLIRIGHRDVDPYWPIGAVGLLLLAGGLSLSGTAPFVFNLLLATGASIISLYATVQYVVDDISIQIIWVLLNIVFMINPLLNVLRAV